MTTESTFVSSSVENDREYIKFIVKTLSIQKVGVKWNLNQNLSSGARIAESRFCIQTYNNWLFQ